jgi:hypothetical protein
MRCAICCETKRFLFNLCTQCRGNEDKKQCYKCLSSQLKMGSNDKIHLQCAFCRFYIHDDTKFQSSFYFLKRANVLRRERLEVRNLDQEVLMQTINHLKLRLRVHKQRNALRQSRRRRRRRQMMETYPDNTDEEEIEADSDNDVVLPHPDLPANYISILELFNTSTIEEPITP